MLLMRKSRLAVAALATGAMIAGCGSSSSSSSSSASAGSGTTATTSAATATPPGASASRAAFRACLKAHGVTLPGRPGGGGRRPGGYGGGGGLFGGGGGAAGRFRANTKLAAAFQACGAGQFHHLRRFVPSHAAIGKFVTCVRRHGYDMPTPNFSGRGPVFPSSIRSNPKFQSASRACASTLFSGRPGAGNPPPPSA